MTLFVEGPFQKIVGIHFPSAVGYALLAIQASGSGFTIPGCNLSANGLSLGDVFAAINTKLAVTTPIYKKTAHATGSQTTTIWRVEMQFSGGVWAPINAWVRQDDIAPTPLAFPFENWNWNGIGDIFADGHAGTLKDTSADGVVAQIHHAFGDTTAALRLGPVVYGPTNIPLTSETWQVNAMVILNLGEIKKALPLHPRDIEFTTDFNGSWTASAFTFKENPSALPMGPNNTPGPVGLFASDIKTETSAGETISMSTVDLTINTQTLKFV